MDISYEQKFAVQQSFGSDTRIWKYKMKLLQKGRFNSILQRKLPVRFTSQQGFFLLLFSEAADDLTATPPPPPIFYLDHWVYSSKTVTSKKSL